MLVRQGSIALILFFLLSSCSKKITCSHAILYYRPTAIGFIGFSTDDLEVVRISKYNKGGNGFSQLVDSYTITPQSIDLGGDTAYRYYTASDSSKLFLSLHDSFDYKIFLPVLNRTYAITDIAKGPDSVGYETRDDHCPAGSLVAEISGYWYLSINGIQQHPELYGGDMVCYAYIKK